MARTSTPRTKKCTRYGKRRKVEHMKDGLSSWCKPCTRDYDREYAKRKKVGVAK